MSDDFRDPLSAAAVISRLGEALKAPTDAALARVLGLSPQTLNSRKTRNAVPYDECVQSSIKYGFSLDWLLTGRGGPAPQSPAGLDEDLLAWTAAAVLDWLIGERREILPDPTSRLIIGTFRVINGLSPRPDSPEKVLRHVNVTLDGFRHLIR